MKRRDGFTLVELMVAIALGVIVMGVVVFAFRRAAVASAQAMQGMDVSQRSRVFLRQLTEDLNARQVGSQIQFSTSYDSGYRTMEFLTSVPYLDRNWDGDTSDAGTDFKYDLVWVKYSASLVADADSANTMEQITRSTWASTASPYPSPDTVPASGDYTESAVVMEARRDDRYFRILPVNREGSATALDPGQSLRGGATLSTPPTLLEIRYIVSDGEAGYSVRMNHAVTLPGGR